MAGALRLMLGLVVALCVSAQKLEGSRGPEAITQLNTVVVGADSTESHSVATPTVTRTRLTVTSEPPALTSPLVVEATVLSTKTIYGFLDFITTVGDTVMVFTPGAKTKADHEPPTQSTKPATPNSPRPKPSPTVPRIVSTSATVPERHLRFTTPAPSVEEAAASPAPPATTQRANKNLLWARLRGRQRDGERPFVLPQRRGATAGRRVGTDATPALPAAGALRREFLSARPASVVPDAPSASSVVGLVTALGGTVVSGDLTTVHTTSVIGTVVDGRYAQLLQSSSVIFAAPPASPTVTRASSVIEGAATEFPQLPTPAAEPEVLPLERLFSTLDEPAPAEDTNRVDSLQERLKARLQAALEARPSREVALKARPRPFTLAHEPTQAARKAQRPFRPEIPLLPRRSYSGRQSNSRRLSAAERLKQRLLQQREKQQGSSGEQSLGAAASTEQPPSTTTVSPNAIVENDELKVLEVNTYRPQDATDYYYELTTLKTLHHITIGRYTNSQWLTDTRTRTVHVEPTVAPTRAVPAIAATALPAAPPLAAPPSKGHGDAVMLPAVQLDPSAPSLPLRTMTETYSTTQLVLKSSVIPLVIGDSTQTITITQSYQVTRLVTALKTMPPMEVFHTAAPPGLLDRDRPLLGQSTENHVDAQGVPVLRLPPPDDLAAIGVFNADHLERQTSPELFGLQRAAAPQPAPVAATPPLPTAAAPFGSLAGLGPLAQLTQLTPQQLAYMQLLGPYLAALRPQVAAAPAQRTIVTSSPVVVSTITTSTRSQAVVVTFRATPSTAYITSTSVFPTVYTTYVTSTVRLPALG